jgi:hypothetical protein
VDLIAAAIARHGAKAVHDAAYKWLQGNRKPLEAVGLIAVDLAQADAIMSQAFKSLSARERAGDYWSSRKELGDFDP